MAPTELPIVETVSLTDNVSRIRSAWSAVERGWQAVTLGLVLTGAALLGVQIPW
jgi:hypothetical protein